MNLSVQHTQFILVGIFLLIVLTRYLRKKTFPSSEELPGLAFAVSGTFAAVQIIYRALFLTECQEFLGVEGVVALLVGGGCALWLSYKEIKKLLD